MSTTIPQFPFKLLLLISLTLLIFSCKDKLVSPSLKDMFYPIKVGNNWEYEIKTYDSTGALDYEGTINETFIYERKIITSLQQY